MIYERIRENGIYLPDTVQSVVFNRQACTIIYVFSRAEPLYFVKFARARSQNYQLESEYENLLTLKRRISDGKMLLNTIPTPIMAGYCNDRSFSVTNFFVGEKELKNKQTSAHYKEAFTWLAAFHRETMGEALFGNDFLTEYVRKFSGCVQKDCSFSEQFDECAGEIIKESSFLRACLIPVCFSHNDFSSANILFNKRNIFVIDWVSSTERGLPLVDMLDLVFYKTNKKLNNYLESFKLLLESSNKDIVFFRENIKLYVEEFEISEHMFRLLLKIFFLSKAEKFFLNNRHNRYLQLIECFRYADKAGLPS